jgi:hypothetical protein
VTYLYFRSAAAAIASTLSVLCAALLYGCAQQPRVTGSWQDGAPRDQVFTKVLVVGVSPHLRRRCAFERVLAEQISSESTTAIASCDAVKEKEPLTRESIELAVADVKADAVVATSLIDKNWGTEEGGSRDTRGGGYYKATDSGFYGVYGAPVVYGEFTTAADVTTLQGEVHVTTKVYETGGPTVVYVTDTTVGGLESTDAAIAAIAQPIAERLLRDGVVR